MNIIFFGPPGAGKGTQSTLLSERHGVKHISTGDLFRNAIQSGSDLGLKAQEFMDQGNLVPDDIVLGLVKEVFEFLDPGQDLILDGFPRTLPQAQGLSQLMKDLDEKIDVVISLEVASDMLVDRLSGRRVCQSCGATYHKDTNPTQKSGVCDICNGAVVQRPDDDVQVISTRLKNYNSSTAPLKKYYQEQGLLKEVSGEGDTEIIYERIARQLGYKK